MSKHCFEYPNGTKLWYLNGKLHREDGPAIEFTNGNKMWYLNDKLHKEGGPAIEFTNGAEEWYLNGKRHREDGPAIEHAYGTKMWYLNGKHHREDGPAVEYADGNKLWYLHLMTDDRKYDLYAYSGDGWKTVWYKAGCRMFTFEEALAHWGGEDYPSPERGKRFVDAIKKHHEAYQKEEN